MRDKEEGGLAERTHLPAIIFALRIIIASCVDGTGLTPSTRTDAVRKYGPHDTLFLRIQLEEARATYLYHFFGHSHGIGSRGCLRLAVGRLVDIRERIQRVMGPAHPMTREITNLLRTALNEQLDWRLDDFDLRMLGPEFLEFGLER